MTAIIFFHNIAVTLSILLAALGLGYVLTNLIFKSRMCDAITAMWISVITGLGSLSVITLILGLYGFLKVTLFIFILLFFAVLGIYLGVKNLIPIVQSGLIRTKTIKTPAIILIIIIVSTLFWIFLTHALMPPHEWDEIAYHLALSKIYVQSEKIHYIPSIVTSNWPLNNTMLFCITLMFGADIAPHLLMLAMTILILFGLVYFGRKFSDLYVGLVAATLFITIPLTKRLAGTGLIDVSMGLYGIAALVSLELWRSNKNKFWLIYCGLNAGFFAGTKLTGTALIFIIAILILWQHLSVDQIKTKALIQSSISFGLTALMVLIPWYMRSLLFTGNPIYPFGYSIFDGRNWDALGAEYHSTMQMQLFSPILPRNIVGLGKTMGLMLIQPQTLGGYNGGLGVIIPICFFLSIFLLGSSPRWIVTNIIVGVLFFIAWFFFASLQLRYLLPIAPIMAWSSAFLILQFYRKNYQKRSRVLIILILSVFIFFDWPWIKINEVGLLINRLPYLSGQITREQWLESEIDIYPAFKYANNNLPQESKILLLPFENRGYYLDLSYFWGHPFSQRVIKFEKYQNPVLLATELTEMGFTHIIDNPNLIYSDFQFWDHDSALLVELEKQCGEELFYENNIKIYKLGKCKSD